MAIKAAFSKYAHEYRINYPHYFYNSQNPFIIMSRCSSGSLSPGLEIPEEFDDLFNIESVISHGSVAVAFLLDDGNVLKINHSKPNPLRFFDLSASHTGIIEGIPYLVQPCVEINYDAEIFRIFSEEIQSRGFIMADSNLNNIGWLGKLQKHTYNNSKIEEIVEEIGKNLFLHDYASVYPFNR